MLLDTVLWKCSNMCIHHGDGDCKMTKKKMAKENNLYFILDLKKKTEKVEKLCV
jgi:hypothetical protein